MNMNSVYIFLIGFGAFFLYILWSCREAITFLVKAKIKGEKVHFIHDRSDNQITGKCPTCNEKIIYIKTEENTLVCPKCNESYLLKMNKEKL